eukprot:10459455-Ditylum_brightwellii.AAC.1
MSYPFDYSQNTLEPDWDVLTQAALEFITFNPVPSIKHIESHQGGIIPINRLLFLPWINVDADILT